MIEICVSYQTSVHVTFGHFEQPVQTNLFGAYADADAQAIQGLGVMNL